MITSQNCGKQVSCSCWCETGPSNKPFKLYKPLKGKFFRFFKVLYLPPLRCHCVGGCWDRIRNVAALALSVRRNNHSARSHPHHTKSAVMGTISASVDTER